MAWDPVQRRKVWTIPEEFPVWSGAAVTAGGVVFYGNLEGWFKAVDAETGNMLTVAQLIVTAALARCESRGAHFRTDYPAPDATLQGRHTLVPGRSSGNEPPVAGAMLAGAAAALEE